ncbi:MAG: hypothetical protein AVDCRST_MAG02-4402, partial [uncultured Rubrobacteraceae bacterium]
PSTPWAMVARTTWTAAPGPTRSRRARGRASTASSAARGSST